MKSIIKYTIEASNFRVSMFNDEILKRPVYLSIPVIVTVKVEEPSAVPFQVQIPIGY